MAQTLLPSSSLLPSANLLPSGASESSQPPMTTHPLDVVIVARTTQVMIPSRNTGATLG
jgi:hypothetical protein